MPKIILATTSPYRIEAFKMLGLDFETAESGIDENFDGRPASPRELVQELARRKAQAVAEKYQDGLIIGFDSVGWFQDNVLEKTKDRDMAYSRLVLMSGKSFQFYTGVCIIDAASGEAYEQVAGTDIMMRPIRASEVDKYLEEDPAYNTYACGFDPLGHRSAAFVKKIDGSYNNFLRGIPLELVAEMLDNIEKKK